jgi:hypothetical protein
MSLNGRIFVVEASGCEGWGTRRYHHSYVAQASLPAAQALRNGRLEACTRNLSGPEARARDNCAATAGTEPRPYGSPVQPAASPRGRGEFQHLKAPAGRQVTSPRRQPWESSASMSASPRRGDTKASKHVLPTEDRCAAPSGAQAFTGHRPPTADAVGYESIAAPRLDEPWCSAWGNSYLNRVE